MESSSIKSCGRFVECSSTPQQKIGYDCGLYVLAIARVIWLWYSSSGPKDEGLWYSSVEQQVTPSVVSGMRRDMLRVISSLRNEK